VYRTDAPALKAGQIRQFLKSAATDLLHGAQHMIQEIAKGKFVPTIMAAYRARRIAGAADEGGQEPHAPSSFYPS